MKNHKKMEIDEQMLVQKYISPDDQALEIKQIRHCIL